MRGTEDDVSKFLRVSNKDRKKDYLIALYVCSKSSLSGKKGIER